MDRRERTNDLAEAVLAALGSLQSEMWTALPCKVVSFDAGAMTLVAQPTIQALRRTPQGEQEWITLPPLLDCPVMFPGGGNFTLTFPVTAGDECLVVFSSRCIDAWWASGKVAVQAELRMHSLSDGFAFVGVRSQPRKLAGISTTNVQLRSTDGVAFLEMAPNNDVKVLTPANATVEAGGVINLKAPLVAIEGNVTVTGTVVAQGNVTGAGISLNSHKHTGVTAGGAQTGGPV